MIEFPYKIEQCVWELTCPTSQREWLAPCGGEPSGGEELNLRECLRVAEQLIEQGCRQVTLLGDEVFAFEGWARLARRLDDAGIRVNVITGATRAGPRQLAQLRRARLACVGVAIDGLSACHDRLRGRTGAFDEAIGLVTGLMEQGFSVLAVTTLTQSNADDLPGLYELLIALGVKAWRLRLAPSAPARAAANARPLAPTRIPEIAKFLSARAAEGRLKIYAGNELGCLHANDPSARCVPGGIPVTQGCQAGLRGLGIDSRGNVKGCQALGDERFVEGNLRTQTLAEIWRQPGAFAYNRRFHPGRLQGRCTGCDLGDICRAGCRSICYFTTGKLYDNPYCCYQSSPVPVRLVPGKAPRRDNRAKV